jgi:transcriptional regulator GlxA family with amidase domain
MMFYLSRKMLNELCDNANVPRISDLYLKPGTSVDDPTIRHIGNALRSAMQHPEEAPAIFVDHVTFALAVHVSEKYGGMRNLGSPNRGKLAPWQERRAKEILCAQLDGNIALEVLAAECGLSVGHFVRLFRSSVGEPPHRWMLRQRVERAKSLLRDSPLSLAEVALACGFCDQSHFTRCFKEICGVSPGAWRRGL